VGGVAESRGWRGPRCMSLRSGCWWRRCLLSCYSVPSLSLFGPPSLVVGCVYTARDVSPRVRVETARRPAPRSAPAPPRTLPRPLLLGSPPLAFVTPCRLHSPPLSVALCSSARLHSPSSLPAVSTRLPSPSPSAPPLAPRQPADRHALSHIHTDTQAHRHTGCGRSRRRPVFLHRARAERVTDARTHRHTDTLRPHPMCGQRASPPLFPHSPPPPPRPPPGLCPPAPNPPPPHTLQAEPHCGACECARARARAGGRAPL
jgi:hypothetical protein